MCKNGNLKTGTKIRFLTGNDRNKIFTIKSDLKQCARTEGCYTAESDNGVEVYIFPSELKKHGYIVVSK